MSDGASEVWPPEQAPYYAHPGEPPAVARLSSTQTAALRAMVAGKPLNQAAADAGVDRTTLYRWRTRDRDFAEALTDWRMDSYLHSRDRMMAIADEAIDAVHNGVKKGDARLAFRLLLDLGRSVKPAAAPAPRQREREHPQAQQEIQIESRMSRVYQKCTDDQLTRLPELMAEIIEIDNARRKQRQAEEATCGDVPATGDSVAEAPTDTRQEEAMLDASQIDANSLAILQAAASDAAGSDAEALQDAAAVDGQSDEPIPIETPHSDERLSVEAAPRSMTGEALKSEPQNAPSTDAAAPLVSPDVATPPAPSDAASAPVVASIIGGVIRELTLADIIRMEEAELEAMKTDETDVEPAAVVEHKSATPSAGFAGDDASQNQVKCCRTLHDDAADG